MEQQDYRFHPGRRQFFSSRRRPRNRLIPKLTGGRGYANITIPSHSVSFVIDGENIKKMNWWETFGLNIYVRAEDIRFLIWGEQLDIHSGGSAIYRFIIPTRLPSR